MKDAINDVIQRKQLIKVAARQHNIPFATLRRHAKKLVLKPGEINLGNCKRQIISDDAEKQLSEHIREMQLIGFGLTRTDVMKLAFDYCQLNDVPTKWSNGTASADWLEGFMKRHRELSLRKPELLSVARAMSMNEPVVKAYFELLRTAIEDLKLKNGSSLYNMDESGLTLVPSARLIVGKRGERAVHQICNSERGEITTVVACYNASGYYIPPVIIFKGKRSKPEFREGFPPNTEIICTESGYIDKTVFLF